MRMTILNNRLYSGDKAALLLEENPSGAFIVWEESMPGFKASLTPLLGVNRANDWVLVKDHLPILKILRPSGILNLLCLCSLNGPTKSKWQHIYLHDLLSILSPLIRPTAQRTKKKETTFKILLLSDNVPGHPRTLMEMYNRINVFVPLTQYPFCSPWIK